MKKYILFLLFLCPIGIWGQRSKKDPATEQGMQKLALAYLFINNYYVDSISAGQQAEDAIKGMLSQLDPHSTYTNARETRTFNESMQGGFEGIGVQYNMLEDTLIVIQSVPKGPAEKAGILSGDRIVSVNDTAIAGVNMSREEIMRRLKGPKDSKVYLKVLRSGIKDTLGFHVTRDKIPVATLDAAYMVTPTIGLIRFNSFGITTHNEVTQAMESLRKKGMQSLILDLRQNGGGFIDAAVNIANEFLNRDDLIVYTKGRSQPERTYKARGGGRFTGNKLAVLVDEHSASAAEIVAGAIQDHDRGTIIGRRTFGKGLVQNPFPLPDGSMIKLTVAHYYTPSGRCIQKPYTKGDKEGYYKDVLNRLNNGELLHADSIHLPDSLRFKTLRLGRTVYGGGGITPDVFIPLDTNLYTPFHRKLMIKGVFVSTNLKYIDRHRKTLKRKYASFDKFKKEYEVPQEAVDLLMAEAEKAGVKPTDEEELQRSLPSIRLHLKALLARDLWDMSEYLELLFTDDPAIKQAVDVLQASAK